MKRIAIVNTRLSNLHSIARAVEECGLQPIVTEAPRDLESVANIILPGVGSFPKAMQHLRDSGLADELSEQVLAKQIPFLGICLGMQLLAATGHEGGGSAGLGWIDGEVRLLEAGPAERLPHVGWNDVDLRRESPIFDGIASGQDFYFVHSYALSPTHDAAVTATTAFAGGFAAAVQREHIFGVQFHPEKSQKPGFALLRNFLAV